MAKDSVGVPPYFNIDPDAALAELEGEAPAAPRESLELEWVHGYAGLRNTANNLECLADGALAARCRERENPSQP